MKSTTRNHYRPFASIPATIVTAALLATWWTTTASATLSLTSLSSTPFRLHMEWNWNPESAGDTNSFNNGTWSALLVIPTLSSGQYIGHLEAQHLIDPDPVGGEPGP